ncbi:major facilitator superfamily transporter [Durotheca rogersii]|uniref:major facilitator superfamily transporter n=1 Tax=Durotheca rogersii TaxID=419775 RepID=UPI00221E4FBF|nr:major facilitator superfamily transporter [Durotheca rogersii]KAI5865753.1 major facilitator superfamily transporter [Durotheca rogersii]
MSAEPKKDDAVVAAAALASDGDDSEAQAIPAPGADDEDDDDDDGLPMDRGVGPWLQVLGCWILFANTWGLPNSFGVFQAYYTATLLAGAGPSAVAWIGSVQVFLMMAVGAAAGRLLDAGRLRLVLGGGAALAALGLFLLGACTRYWHVLLAQAVCVGAGTGLLGLTSVAIIPLYFRRRRMVAVGVAATGSSLAGIVYPIMHRRLIARLGFPWAVRVFAFVVTASLLVAMAILRLRPNMKPRGARFSTAHFRDKPYVVFCIAFTLIMAAAYVPYFFVDAYAARLGVGPGTSFYVLSAMNGGSLAGRVVPNWLADRYGGLNVMVPCGVGAALAMFFFRFARDLPGLLAAAAAYGFLSGGTVALPVVTIANFTPAPADYATRMGIGYSVAALGALVGNPLGGAAQRPQLEDTVEAAQREFQGTWIFGGGVMLAAVLTLLLAKYLKFGSILKGKC